MTVMNLTFVLVSTATLIFSKIINNIANINAI
jgi:hypothetical protein